MRDELWVLLHGDRGRVRSLVASLPDERVAQGHRAYQRRFGPDEEMLEIALAHPDPRVGVAAVTAVPRDKLRVAHAQRWMNDPSWLVVEFGAYVAGELEEPSLVPRLVELAQGHEEPLVREAALASLGAIGDARALPVVLEALRSKNVYLRRRALVISVAFDSDELSSAVEALRDDRDAQIRQLFVDLERDPYQ
ncbi:MAG: HEAT repeat domain-containing protein [Ferrimicrobium sp.]|uniref:HEAT repeat domain-containing protein n=1 Tax=Ferrimicrobium acidiphilum TaxID=121039 RepID=A0ABV3Y294_9ACTN|nr:HEAT repeat domain-containing protein [Ferrimicrobium sp.]MCL5972861.1 HEAT repeat domain-containing protein [Actinomycetota bacterium]